MSCSKIFSGDLPELTYEIIKFFQNDYSTLYSCILVNRLWCRLTIPLLWENPFSIYTENNDFIKIYLHNNLNNDFITILNEYKIFNNSLSTNTLFNYPSFLKYLNTYMFIYSVDKWVDYVMRNSKFKINYLFKHFDSVSKLIFKIFIENEIKLHTLEIVISGTYYSAYFKEILELILQNQNFIHNIGNLKLYIYNYDENMDRVLQITHLHQNLKKILICDNSFGQLNVLESVHIIYCYFLYNSFTKPFKLKSLIFNEKVPQIETLQQLLQLSGDYLENFSSFISIKQVLLELIIKYCKNIKFLNLHEFENHITYKIFDLIEDIKQNLNYLSINIREDYHLANGSSVILNNLGQALPSKLEYLNLELNVKESDFRTFLENSQDVFINKLLISLRGSSDDISHYIKEYIMKGERVKYLAIKGIKNGNQLSEEFKLYNIEVRSYDDLFISITDFIKNNY
ncbi:unnamed protein product [Rhizophagus irregularis]|nr:unnamed protein product [Rhizophagus irregularis]